MHAWIIAATLCAWARRQAMVADRARAALGTDDEAEAMEEARNLLAVHAWGETTLAEYAPPSVAATLLRMAGARREAAEEMATLPPARALPRALLLLAAPGITSEGVRVCLTATETP